MDVSLIVMSKLTQTKSAIFIIISFYFIIFFLLFCVYFTSKGCYSSELVCTVGR